MLLLSMPPPVGADGPLKPRVIVLTDISPNHIEPDDTESMIRLLVLVDLVEIEGLVATTGWSNDGGQERPDLLHALIDAYAKDLPNLRQRSRQAGHQTDESQQSVGYWPSAEYLRSRTVLGSRTRGQRFVGANNDSPGSDLIIRCADEADARPVWVLGWGGGNTLAQAIWRVRKDRSPDQLKSFLKRVRFYAITDQDRGYQAGTPFDSSSHQWMRREFSQDLLFIWDEGTWMFQNGTGKRNWAEYEKLIQNRGHLGRMYPKYRYGVEGDTPSFWYVLPIGLNDPQQPGQGGWGGFYEWAVGPDGQTSAYCNQKGLRGHEISHRLFTHFYPATFQQFVARMNWARDGVGNREPIVAVGEDLSLDVLRLTPGPGTTLTLDASGSRDLEGDSLRYSWWILPEAGTYPREIALANTNTSRLTLLVPADSGGQQFHVICEVTDNGTPNLTSYRRILVKPINPEAAPEAIHRGTKP
ncbi:MAG: DUF1593 domain-containing protein [Verrucomicrobia bacterium]|nr:DUF1593 domain-containing protein [Verrucomicrobiota bacterium]